MFTRRTMKLLGGFYSVASFCKYIPYRWDFVREELVLPKSKWHFPSWCILMAYTCFTGLFMSCNLIHGVVTRTMSITTICIDFDLSFFWVFMGILHINMLRHTKAVANYINQLFRFNKRMRLKYFIPWNGVKFNDKCELVIAVLMPSVVSGSLCYCSLFLIQPNDRRYFYHFFPWTDSIWFYLVYFLWELYFMASGWILFYFYTFLFLLHCQSICFWTKEMIPYEEETGHERKWTKIVTGGSKLSLEVYKNLQVISCMWEMAIGYIYTPGMQLFTISNHADMFYICIKLNKVIPTTGMGGFGTVFIMWFFFEIIFYPVAGDVQYYAHEYKVQLLKREGRFPMIRKREISLQPLGVKVGSVYVMNRFSCLMIISLVVYFSVNIILTF